MRWISSTKSKVRLPAAASFSASAKACRKSATPEKTADKGAKRIPTASASSRAIVVLPVPGGPQRLIDDNCPAATMRPIAPSGPVRCSCPTTSARVRGRSRTASGADRESVEKGESVYGRVERGGRRILKKKNKHHLSTIIH